MRHGFYGREVCHGGKEIRVCPCEYPGAESGSADIYILRDEEGIDERDIYVEKESGRQFERPVYRSLVDNILREGDLLVVTGLPLFIPSCYAIEAKRALLQAALRACFCRR